MMPVVQFSYVSFVKETHDRALSHLLPAGLTMSVRCDRSNYI